MIPLHYTALSVPVIVQGECPEFNLCEVQTISVFDLATIREASVCCRPCIALHTMYEALVQVCRKPCEICGLTCILLNTVTIETVNKVGDISGVMGTRSSSWSNLK